MEELTKDLTTTRSLLQHEVAEREIELRLKDREIIDKQKECEQREEALRSDHERVQRILQQELVER